MNYHSSKLYSIFIRLLERLGINPAKMKEFIKFGTVGGLGVLVNMGFFFIFTRYASIRIEYASPMAIEISILCNFFLNNIWTFRRRDTIIGFGGRILRYHLVTAVAGGVNYVTLLLLANKLGMHDLLANLIGIGLGTFINFFLNSMWTWRITGTEEPDQVIEERDQSPEEEIL